MQQLQEDLKTGNFRQFYLLYGPEAYLRIQYKNKLKDALVTPEDRMNYHYFEGKGINSAELIDLAETLPFFADRRVIIVENSGFFKKTEESLVAYVQDPSPSVCFIFVETEVDKRGRMYKAVDKHGRTVEFGPQKEGTLKKWILVSLKKEGKKITEPVLDYFLEKTGTDMENISRELEKLFSYTLGREVIKKQDVDAVCTRRINNQIFDMVEAIAQGRQRQALRYYYDLLSLKEPSMRILYLIGRQFNLLLQTKELKAKGYDDQRIGEKTGLRGFLVKKYASLAARFTKEQLREALAFCVETEEAVKTGKINDVMSVELLIVKYTCGT